MQIQSFLKRIIKKILNFFGWRLVKNAPKPTLMKENLKLDYIKSIIDSNGIFHIGAHRGSEAPIYYWLGKDVIWIEAIPKIYEDLKNNIYNFSNQKAYNYLITNNDNEQKNFFISNNDGASSSIYEFGDYHNNFDSRKFKMTNKIKLNTTTLETFLIKENIDLKDYNFWTIDVQGAELEVLKSAKNFIKFCKYLYIEISMKEFYKGGVQFDELNTWLNQKGFEISWDPKDVHTNVLYKKIR